MSVPLRQPRFDKKLNKKYVEKDKLTILTLKNGLKMVVSCDAYNGIIMAGDIYKCVLCDVEFVESRKEEHKESDQHQRSRLMTPHLEELSENLVRQLDGATCYCTICNVTTLTVTITRHIKTEQHLTRLSKAINRTAAYASDLNNNK